MAKVLIHSNYAPNNFGGIEYVVSQLISISRSLNLDVECFFGGDSNKEVELDGGKVLYVQRKILKKIKGACILSLGNFFFSLRALKADLIIFQEPYPFLWPALFFVRFFCKAEVVVLTHADPDAAHLIKGVYKKIRAFALSGSHVVTTSPQLLSRVGSRKYKSSHVIPLGIPEGVPCNVSEMNSEPYVLYFGRLAEYKGIEYLLDSIRQLPYISFVIAGSGLLSDFVAAYVKDNNMSNLVFINGNISEQQKLGLIRGCSFLVLPSTSQNEAFGIVQLEAMREGKAIVNTNLENGVNFVAPNGICAVTCERKDSVALSSAIEMLWSDESMRLMLSENAKIRFEEKFTSSKFFDSWSALIRGLIDSKLGGV